MTLKTGDLIVIDNTDKLQKPIEQFHKKWGPAPVLAAPAMVEMEMGLAYSIENKRLIGIVTEIMEEDHRDFDIIKVREQTGGFRYCRRYILENI